VLTDGSVRETREGETVEFHGVTIPVSELFPG
jgi:hypothetical protein